MSKKTASLKQIRKKAAQICAETDIQDDKLMDESFSASIKNVANNNLWSALGGKLFFPPGTKENNRNLSLTTVCNLIFSVRLASSLWCVIADCDEVYNYWEPLHLLLYGRGFQTWEYSPVYAIRSWLYIGIHYLPGHLMLPLFTYSKITFFYFLRSCISALCLTADICFYDAICKRLGSRVGFLFVIFHVFSVGMFNASCAFLPSSFSMTMNTFAMAAYLKEKWFFAIFFTCVSAMVGWPFAAVLGLPIVVEMLIFRARRLFLRFIGWSALSAAIVLPPMYFVDLYYYGKNVIAPLNIVLYNVFSAHGPDLYGVEPPTFYLKNLFLNWNVALVPVFIVLPLSFFAFWRSNIVVDENGRRARRKIEMSLDFWYLYIPVILLFLSLALWLLIFFLQPHKEERFLFPIFPLISVLAAIGVDSFLRLTKRLGFVAVCGMIFFVAVSLSRGYALHRNYSSSMDVYKGLNEYLMSNQANLDFSKMKDPIRLCVGKEWYRFPSSFFLPELVMDRHGRKRYVDLRFVRSEFRGLLPKHFAQMAFPNVTRLIPTAMNDLNLEEPSRYVDVNSCDFIVDLDTSSTTKLEPNYSEQPEFTTIISKPFLLAAESHPLFRSFYIPFTDDKLRFGNLYVLKRENV